MSTPAYEPRVLGTRPISGGDHLVTISVAPGVRVHLQVPASVVGVQPLTPLASHVVDNLTTPHGVKPNTRNGSS